MSAHTSPPIPIADDILTPGEHLDGLFFAGYHAETSGLHPTIPDVTTWLYFSTWPRGRWSAAIWKRLTLIDNGDERLSEQQHDEMRRLPEVRAAKQSTDRNKYSLHYRLADGEYKVLWWYHSMEEIEAIVGNRRGRWLIGERVGNESMW